MRVRVLHLSSSRFALDVRLSQIGGRWLASADTPDGPSLGLGRVPHAAVVQALEPFESIADELIQTLPDEFYWVRAGD